MPTPVILDVDTGVDDALALLVAARHPDLELLGVSCVAGNVSLDRVVENTLRVLAAAGRSDVPVAAGAQRPLIESPRAATVHGTDGLGGVELAPSPRQVESEHAVEFLRRTILASTEPVTLVALAPQTNLALLLRMHPEVIDHVDRLVFMGGSASVGNATAVAEFNVWHDPEAAAIVLDSGVPAYMYGLDVFNAVAVEEYHAARLAASDEPLARVVGALLGNRVSSSHGGEPEYSGLIGDAGAVCSLVDPDALGTRLLPVHVELAGRARGQTVVNLRGRPGEDLAHGLVVDRVPVEVALTVDAPRLAGVFLDSLGLPRS
ncbi:nucleoside hydrolase [Agromyces sp. NPDC058110]|uniref:nucleoside hydrolase n=1 Tax=Agromyces sp. NPDC058110 TaxID=3346345 RepID=UPI0036DE740C